MPFSINDLDDHLASLIRELAPSTLLDIGPGAGKYGFLSRAVAAEDGFPLHTTCVEIDPVYVQHFNLTSLYDRVVVADAIELIKIPSLRFDLVVIGDCIEHMRKSHGIDLINFLIYRAGYIVIVYPEASVQDDWQGHAAEAHISVWGPEDFRGLDMVHYRHDSAEQPMHLFLIKGYQPSRKQVAEIRRDTMLFR